MSVLPKYILDDNIFQIIGKSTLDIGQNDYQ